MAGNGQPAVQVHPQGIAVGLGRPRQELRALGGELLVLANDPRTMGDAQILQALTVPAVDDWLSPILHTIPLQLLAYYTAVHKGTDVDRPRNLAESVTVE
jgi:glutamine---fructose-6-phosphate transaminase (isomerizing)